MNQKWTAHLKDKEGKEKFKAYLKTCTPALTRLDEILSEEIEDTVKEMSKDEYDLPGAPQGQQGGNTADAQPADNPYAHLLSGITAEDGRQKYASIEDALGSIPHAQSKISELSQQIKDLEQKVQESANIEDVLERVRSQQASQQGNPQQPELDETKLAQIMDQHLTAREMEAVQRQNAALVASSLKGLYGDKAEEAYSNKAKDLGMSVEVFNNMARSHPQAVLAYFDKPSVPSSGFGSSDVNTAALRPPSKEVDIRGQFLQSSESEAVQKWREVVSKHNSN
jgi:hypothetical protein